MARSRELIDIKHIFHAMNRNDTGKPTLIAGETGIGKTTFIKDIGKLLGMAVVTLEAPTIVEEEVINIPFVVFDTNGQEHSAVDHIDVNKANIQLAKSHLAATLKNKPPLSDQNYLINIKTAPAAIKDYYTKLGGTDTVIPTEIQTLRRKFKCILFVDEYWRKTNANIRNILRGLLNRQIGDDPLPAGVFPIFASNLQDVSGSIEPIPTNAVSHEIMLKAPSKEKFLRYIVDTAKEKGHPLAPEFVTILNTVLTDAHISNTDIETEIRTSPRRWEEIIKYIQAAYEMQKNSNDPDNKNYRATLAAVDSMFKNEHNKKSPLHDVADKIVKDLFDKSFAMDAANAYGSLNWRNTLEHQIAVKMKLGNYRKYVPIVMGPPGIGKTSYMVKIAENLGLLYITLDASVLSQDDVTGIPLPQKSKEGTMSTRFAKPALLQKIENKMAEAKDAWLTNSTVSEEERAKRKSKWDAKTAAKQPHYLLLVDEFNRVSSSNTFNSLRRVVLDKRFNDYTKVPDDVIMVAAMNPNDKGVKELTGHMKDAVDLIDAMPSWKATFDHFKNDVVKTSTDQIALSIIEEFADKFTLKTAPPDKTIPVDSLPFMLSIGDGAWISPRDYHALLEQISEAIVEAENEFKKDPNLDLDEEIIFWINEKFIHALQGIMTAHELRSSDFLEKVHQWLESSVSKLLEKEKVTKVKLGTLLDKVLADPTQHLTKDRDWITYHDNYNRNAFMEELTNYIQKLLEEEKNKLDILVANTIKLKKRDTTGRVGNDIIHITDELWSKLEAIHNEIVIAADDWNLGDIRDALDNVLLDSLRKLGSYSETLLKVDTNLPPAEQDKQEAQIDRIMQEVIEKIHNIQWVK